MLWNELTGQNSLWEEISELQKRMNRALATERDYPGLRLYQKDDEVLIRAEVPGIDPDSINLTIGDDNLLISFEKESQLADDGARLLRRERPRGKFSRTVRLPYRVESDSAEADYKRGILTIRLPRAEEDKPRKISVRSS